MGMFAPDTAAVKAYAEGGGFGTRYSELQIETKDVMEPNDGADDI